MLLYLLGMLPYLTKQVAGRGVHRLRPAHLEKCQTLPVSSVLQLPLVKCPRLLGKQLRLQRRPAWMLVRPSILPFVDAP